LSVDPVDNNIIAPEPFCTPPDVPLEKEVVAVKILVADGIVPVALTATPEK
jgi:hypothetical protein